MSTGTISKSISDSFTEARARYVLGKIFDEFNSIIFRGFTTISTDNLRQWRDDVQFVMERNALIHFEIQFRLGEQTWAVRYEVSGRLVSRDDESGGLDFYNIPANASLSMVVKRDPDNEEVNDYVKRRGWGTNGVCIAESSSSDRSFSKDGFGVNRKIKGNL